MVSTMATSCVVLDESSRSPACFLVGKLLRRRFHEVARRTCQGASDTAIHRKLCTANGVDHHSGGIRRIPDLESHLGAQGYAAERGALETDVGKLAIRQPGNVVTGTDVDIVGFQRNVELTGNRLRLGYLL